MTQVTHHDGAELVERLSAAADRQWCRLRLDRLAGGRRGDHVVREDMRRHPDTVRSFRRIRRLLVAETVVGVAAIVVAVVLTRVGTTVPWAVWFRATVVLCITLTLSVFAWRAQLGLWWAYARLSLFSRVFPVVTLVIAAIPHLYPWWMVLEQVVFSALMIGIAVVLSSHHMRAAFPRPHPPVGHAAPGTGMSVGWEDGRRPPPRRRARRTGQRDP